MTRPVLVALHGLGADHHQPLALIDDDLQERCSVLAPDLRGHGDCDLDESPELLTIAQLATDVAERLDELDTSGGVLLVGISMGAAVAAELASRKPAGLRGILLIRPAWHWQPSPDNLAVYPRIADLLQRQGSRLGNEMFRASADYAHIASVSTLAAVALLGQFDEPRAASRAQRLIAIPASAPTRPGPSDLPITVLGNDLDPVHPLALAEAVGADLEARFVQVAPRYDSPGEHRRHVAREIRRLAEDH